MRLTLLATSLGLAIWPLASDHWAQTPLQLEIVGQGLEVPSWAGAPEGDDRIFVLNQWGGKIHIIRDGQTLPVPFLDISSKVFGYSHSGLLSMAFHPQYAENGQFFVYYVVNPHNKPPSEVNDPTVRLERYTVSSDPDVADPASAVKLLEQLHYNPIHKGGGPVFGPDGYLYVAIGEGGAAGSGVYSECPEGELDNWYGKILRIDVDGALPYTIPPDNPFVGVANALPEIYHRGFRNPWRFSFDRETGDMYIGDVGWNTTEEIDVAPPGVAGLGFGWPIMEGTVCNVSASCPASFPPCGSSLITQPIYEYPHAGLPACVIGGYVYRGCAVPDLQGTYFFADFTQGLILSFRYDPVGGVTDFQDRSAELDPADVINDVVSFGEDGNGELLIVSFGGTIYRVVPAQTPATLVDCDGNEFDDACEISFDPVKDLNGDGVLDVCQDLSADTAAVSLSGGGTQVLSLHPGVGYANFPYVLLGSLSGTRPGYTAFGVTIPLNPDPYFFLTLQDPGQTPLVGSVGTLDDQGEATVFFLVPGNSNPGFVGLTVNHAFGVMDALGLIPIDASNAIPVEMLP